MTTHFRLGAIFAVVLALAASQSMAVTVTTDVLGGNDGSVRYIAPNQDLAGTPPEAIWDMSTGGTSGSVIGLANTFPYRTAQVFVMAFRLPELPSGMNVATAQLDVYLERVNEVPNFNADLWGLGYRSTNVLLPGTVGATPTTGDFNDVDGDGFPGEGAAVECSDTVDLGVADGISARVKLADDVITPLSSPSATTAISTSTDALASFIRSLYANGAVGGETGDFAFLRLSPDANMNVNVGTWRYEMYTNNDDPASGAVAPALTIEFAHNGDANVDGLVNLADLQILGDNWQSGSAGWSEADFTGDGIVNLADLQILGDNWGFGVNPDMAFDEALALAGIAIPEPAGIVLLLGAASLLIRHRG